MTRDLGKVCTYIEDGVVAASSGFAFLVIDADVVAIKNALERNLK